MRGRKEAAGIVLLALSVLCIVAGILRGEAGIVLTKSVYVCLECIGIG